jgi:hypothetical protein
MVERPVLKHKLDNVLNDGSWFPTMILPASLISTATVQCQDSQAHNVE